MVSRQWTISGMVIFLQQLVLRKLVYGHRNRSHPDDTSEWGSGSVISICFNLGELNILATSGNDLGITIYGSLLKDEAIKMFEDKYQSLEVKMRCKDRMHKSQQDKAHNFLMLCKQLELRVIEIVNKLKERTQRLLIWDLGIKIFFRLCLSHIRKCQKLMSRIRKASESIT
nr:DDB1- and CUL4-associated factor 13 [Tanacetum cinerariifolium]